MHCTFYERVVGPNTHFQFPSEPYHAGAYFFVLCGAVSAPLFWGDWPVIAPSNRAEHLLIHRIQSHTNPKSWKGFLKQAGQKSVKEELPKQRKGPKRAVKCRLKVPMGARYESSSLPTRTNWGSLRTLLLHRELSVSISSLLPFPYVQVCLPLAPAFANYLTKKWDERKHYDAILIHSPKKLVHLIFHIKKSRRTYRWQHRSNDLNSQ